MSIVLNALGPFQLYKVCYTLHPLFDVVIISGFGTSVPLLITKLFTFFHTFLSAKSDSFLSRISELRFASVEI